MEKKRQNIHHQQDKLEKQKEMFKKLKNDEERKIMETQIAELENQRKFEKHNEKLQAQHEKEQVLRELEDDLEKQKIKKKEYIEVCQKQYKENMELKESLKKRELERKKEDNAKSQDIFGNLFEKKTHVSYELAARNQKKFDALTKILERENEKKNKARNYTEFEEGDNKLDKKNDKDQQKKRIKHQEDVRSNLDFLQEQIKFRKEKEKFERDAELKQANIMNKRALDELEIEAARNQDMRKKRIQHKNELKTQGRIDPYSL